QTQQALISIGGGGFTGKGYGKGLQKFGFIPEAQSDFIFAAFSEEIGFFGDAVLLALYLGLAFFFLSELHKVRDDYYKMLGVAIISLIIMQAFVNMGVNLRILPNTGLTLPFISFGGTALIVNLIQLSLLYKIIYKS
ncbi:MAG TPA: FtsW/RodA/SpoVE family cell cycle protein, partial [Candidatus Absconditabacterales bacterium]|nr:FtsW/RodA/SpoVE family cell cycle protein [Candidatus Absconditabacterales bacterium]